MEKAANELSEKIASLLDYNDEKKSVIAYGLIAIFQMTAIAAVITVIGLLTRSFYESALIFLGVGLLKKSTGGAHSQTMLGCMVISVLSISALGLLSRYVLNMPVNIFVNIGLSAAVYASCLLVFIKRVPVDCANKRITKPEKIKRLRRQSFAVLTAYFLVTVLLIVYAPIHGRFYGISSSIRLIMIWQTFMLTASAANMISDIDSKIFYKGGQV